MTARERVIEAFCIHGNPMRVPCAKCGRYQRWLTYEEAARLYPQGKRYSPGKTEPLGIFSDPNYIMYQREENARMSKVMQAMATAPRRFGPAVDALLPRASDEVTGHQIGAKHQTTIAEAYYENQRRARQMAADELFDIVRKMPMEHHELKPLPWRRRARWWLEDLAYRIRRWWQR